MENRVWHYRNERNLTLAQLSRLSGISISELNNIENHVYRDIKLSTAIRLSKVLHVDIYELFCIKK